MKKPQWDDSIEDFKEFFDTTVIPPNEELKEGRETAKVATPKTQFTELRRRIEERLDSKRIEQEFNYDDSGGLLDNVS